MFSKSIAQLAFSLPGFWVYRWRGGYMLVDKRGKHMSVQGSEPWGSRITM